MTDVIDPVEVMARAFVRAMGIPEDGPVVRGGVAVANGWELGIPAARAALTAAEAAGMVFPKWQSVENAPHGVEVLLYCPHRGISNPERIELGYASQGAVGARSRHGWATHWMPLPTPPLTGPEQATREGDATP